MKVDIEKYGLCKPCLKWYQGYDSFEQAWNECHRGDWMIRLAHNIGVNDRLLTLTKARHAKLVLHLMKDQRSINAVHAAEAYGKGEISRDELDRYASEARRVYFNSAYNLTSYAAYSAASSAVSPCVTAADAADSVYYSSYNEAAYDETLLQCADICREVLTKEVFKILKNEKH